MPHVGGIPTRARFVEPGVLGAVCDESCPISWQDNDLDPTGLFSFFYQPANVPYGALLSDPAFAGTAIPGGTDVLISDPANTLSWDTSSVPAGTYFVYAFTRDPPLAGVYGMSLAPVTVQHPGDPLWPAVVVDEPDGVGDRATESFAIRWRASGEGTLTATVTAVPEEGEPVVVGVDQTGCLTWDLTGVPLASYHSVFVTVEDDAGRTHAAWSRDRIVVLGPADGTPSSCEMPAPDAGVGPPGETPGCGCAVGPAAGGGDPVSAIVIAVVALAAARGVRRRPRRG
jgi:MYXO-CTERM domain-containing protein